MRPHRQRIRSLAFTRNNEIVSCGEDRIVQITRLDDVEQPRTLTHDSAKLYDMQLLEDGVLATCGSDNLIHIWRLEDDEPVGTLKGHLGTVSCLDFSNNRIASGGYDTQVRIWHYKKDFDPATRHTKLIRGWNKRG
jgi:WD40 repeat protein